MLQFTTGDILEANAEALVNTVNCVGVMGRGIALRFKEKFPANFSAYAAACKLGEVQPGRVFAFETGWVTSPKYIINFPTKRHWRGKSRIQDIEAGLGALREFLEKKHVKSVAIPPLGSGLGGLRWGDVRELVERTLRPLNDVEITVYEPDPRLTDTPPASTPAPPVMTTGRAALIGLMQRYLSGLLDPTVTLLEVHKLMYFLQSAGEPLRLEYSKGTYGPYAVNLRHVLRRVEGHYISGFKADGDSPSSELRLLPGATEDARQALKSAPDTRQRIERVAELVDGFESPFGLELLATVLWVANDRRTGRAEEVIAGTYDWGERKRQFTGRQIRLGLGLLASKGWL